MSLKKIERSESSPTSPGTPQTRQDKVIQWNISSPKYKLDDLVLDSDTLGKLLEVVTYFENQELLFITWSLAEHFSQENDLAVNLYGPPGTGKTMAAHAIAYALRKRMICVDYAEIESKYVGETSKNLSRLFQTAQEKDSVIFFDEADALLSKRVTNMTSLRILPALALGVFLRTLWRFL